MVGKDKYWLLLCRQAIEESLGWRDSTQWGNDDFEALSDRLWTKTHIRLSLSTLKRLWGKVRYDHLPTSATLNALAQFLDYTDWRTFCHDHPVPFESPEQPEPISSPLPTAEKNGTAWYRSLLVVVPAMILGISAFLVLKRPAPDEPVSNAGRFSFASKKVTEELPNSVVFDYEVSGIPDPQVMIQQTWDPSRREMVDAAGNQHTSIYYYPGFFTAKLIVNDEIKKEVPVFIQTKGWRGIVQKEPLPVYLNEKDMERNAGIGIRSTTLAQKINTTDFNNQWVQFVNVRPFDDIDPADFALETTLRNTSEVEESLCRKVKVSLLGKESAIIIPLATKGCIADLDLLAGDRWIYGKTTDLSSFGCDFENAQHLTFAVKNQRLMVMLNNVTILDAPQFQSIGPIVGIRVAFEGAGEIQSLHLSTPGKGAYTLIPEAKG